LFDDNGNGMEAPDDPEFDDVGRLLYYLEDLDETILSVAFATAQELAKVLDDLPHVTVDGGVAHYDVGEQELTYDVRVAGNGPVVTAPIDFELDLDPLFDTRILLRPFMLKRLSVSTLPRPPHSQSPIRSPPSTMGTESSFAPTLA
jgi:hypothetical protein